MIKNNFIVLLFLPILSSCVALAVGGATGVYVGSDKRTIGTMIDDASITTKINATLLQDDSISTLDINVDTNERIVILSGNVLSKEDETRLISIAAKTKGVKQVISKIKIDEDY